MPLSRKRLRVLDPCHEDWAGMVGADAERFCESCRTRVFDLSTMSEKQARKLLSANRGKTLCVRYKSDARGNVVHQPPRPAPIAAGAVLSAALAGGCASHGSEGLLDSPSEGVCTDIDGSVMACETDEVWPPEVEAPQPNPSPEPDIVADGEEPAEPEDDGYWFDEEPLIEQPLDPEAPETGCNPDDGFLVGVVVVPDENWRERRTQEALRAHSERVRQWLAGRKQRRQERKAQRRLARADR